MPYRLARTAQEPAQQRHAHELAGDERPDVARPRMLGEDGGLDHRPVPWEDARMIGDEQGTTGRGHMLDARRLDPPVVAIERLEDGQE